MRKLNKLLLVLPLLIPSLASCNSKKATVTIHVDDNIVTSKVALASLKENFERNNVEIVDKDGDYEINLILNSELGEQGYTVKKDNKTFNITGGDATGMLYGAYQLGEDLNLTQDFEKINDSEGTPYLRHRGMRLQPLMDCRTPSYTASGDSTRANIKETWDLNYWGDVFRTMSEMRYNVFNFSTLCAFPSMVKVEKYPDVALDDIWVYDGEYDDTYLGNCTNMFRPEHLQEGNYHIYKKMTIDEKIAFFQKVVDLCHSYGIKFAWDTMNIYTFSETYRGLYGITDDRGNETTKDYLYESAKALLNTYDIDIFKVSAGENMDYPSDTKMETEQWIYDVYGRAVLDTYGKREDKDNFIFGYSYSEENWPLWKDFPFEFNVATRYADTHMYAVTDPVFTQEQRDALPDGVYDCYNLRNEDAYHFTWADIDWARDFCRNMKDKHSNGFIFGSTGYYMGNEYEFVDEKLNGTLYWKRHWLNYTMFGRFSYNPEISDEYFMNLVYDHYRDVNKEDVLTVWNTINKSSEWLTEFQKLFYLGGTDSAWYPEMCQSHSTFGGYLDIKRFYKSDNAYGGSNYLSFDKYARAIKAGQTKFTQKTPFQVAETLRSIVKDTNGLIAKYNSSRANNVSLDNIIEDQKTVAILASFYAEKIDAAMNLRLYNDTKDTSYKDKALANTNNVISLWDNYTSSFLARFKAERFTRMGMVDPAQYIDAVKKDLNTINKWTCRDL